MGNSSWGTRALFSLVAFAVLGLATTAWAGIGQPSPGQIGMQGAVTEVARGIHSFHDLVNTIIFGIAGFVGILLLIVLFRFNEKANPNPSRITHNTALEVAWTVVPILILVVIAIPSFKLLYLQYSFPKPDLTIKAIGNTWFWEYEYPDHDGFTVTSNVLRDEDLLRKELGEEEFNKRYGNLTGVERSRRLYADAAPLWAKSGQPRLLAVDNEIAVPVNKVVHVLVTANDVIHNWTVPSFGSKVDAVPGRITATWFKAEREGVYYGQCSELCGKDHAFMPIAVRVVNEDAFNQWVEAAKARDWERARNILQAATENSDASKVASAGERSIAQN
ncbi:MAG: cytochrome c oxidase subunit II [Proteobacteria bacterium]|jgi:cytochrome c oxidase, subunit II|nr:MAG: cytochrome c oxidase subunit II [Pseudomonadota bacterium]